MIATACSAGSALASAQSGGAPGVYANGFEHSALGTATVQGGADGGTVIVQNLSFNGGNGVEVRSPTGKGKGAKLNFGPLLFTPGASATVSFLNTSGHPQCTRTIASSGNGVDHSTFDLSGMGAVSVTIDQYGDDGVLISTKTFGGPIGETNWLPAATCGDGSATIESVRWTKSCSLCAPTLEIARVCPSDGFTWGPSPRARLVVRGDVPTQGQFGDVIDSMIVTASGVPSFAVVERHIETFGAAVTGAGAVHLSEACAGGTVCSDQSLAHVHLANVGGSGEDGAIVAVPPSTILRLRKRPELLYQAWDDTLRFSLFHPAWSEPRSIACASSVGLDGRITLSFDASELGASTIVLTTSLNGAATGVVSGNSSSIRLSAAASDWLALDPIFTGEVGARLRSGVIAEVGAGRPATVGRLMTIQNGLQTTQVLANAMKVELIGVGQIAGISGGAVAGRLPSGGAFDLFDLSWQLVCGGDLNGDRVVEDTDFVIFATSYDLLLCDDPAMPVGCGADLNYDGAVDDLDFVLFAKAYDELLCP